MTLTNILRIAWLLSFTAQIDTLSYAIAFVHIGDNVPVYLQTAIEQARLFNQDCPIYVIASKDALARFKQQNDDTQTILVSCESLTPSPEHSAFIQHSKLDKQFRQGFWNHATERFFYLYECMRDYKLHHVFHLENDVMMYANLHDMLPTFMTLCPAIGATFDNDQRCIPGFMYIKNALCLQPLISYIARTASQTNPSNDMESIARYRITQGAQAITALPIIMPEYATEEPLRSPAGHTTCNTELYCQYAEAFASVFDGAALGQYLGGIDPRNGNSAPGFINETCLFNPAKLTIFWQEDSQGRKIPYMQYNASKSWPINNLHIHSKNLKTFRS